LPLAAVLAARGRLSVYFAAKFFAGFCLIANGAYIGLGSIDGIGDAGDMLRHGSPRWLLIAFGSLAVLAGLAVWHSLGTVSNLWRHRPAPK
jgi:hypothetical protein